MAAPLISDYLDTITRILKDDAGILDAAKFELKGFIAQAVRVYQKLRPYEKVYELSGTGSCDYAVSLFTDWKDKFSQIISIEYPIETSGEPTYLKETEWEIRRTPTGNMLRFYSSIPTGEKANIVYTTYHTLTEDASTIYESDYNAICSLTASLACGSLSQYYSQTTRPGIEADVTDYEDKGRIYREQAEVFMKSFTDHMSEFGCGFTDQDFEGIYYREPIFHSPFNQ